MMSLSLERVKELYNQNHKKKLASVIVFLAMRVIQSQGFNFSQNLLHSIYEVKSKQVPGARSLWKLFKGSYSG